MNHLQSFIFSFKRYFTGKYMFVEYSCNIPMIYSPYIWIKFLIKFWGIFRNNIPVILNPTNVTRIFLGGSRNTTAVFSIG